MRVDLHLSLRVLALKSQHLLYVLLYVLRTGKLAC